MSDETGFVIDGRTYPVPTLDTFSIDEAQVLYDYAGVSLEDFGPAHPSWPQEEKDAHEEGVLRKAKNPGFKKALVHVAYARGNPQASPAEVREVAGRINILEATLALFAGDVDPPAMTDSQNELENGSDSSLTSSSSDSGSPLNSDSDGPVSLHEPTGTIESDTYSPESVPTR